MPGRALSIFLTSASPGHHQIVTGVFTLKTRRPAFTRFAKSRTGLLSRGIEETLPTLVRTYTNLDTRRSNPAEEKSVALL